MNSEELNIQFLEVKDSAYRYAVSLLHDTTEAEDVVQDLYERLWRRRLIIRRVGFRSLVMTTVRNMSLDRLRRQRLNRHTAIEDEPLAAESPEVDNPVAIVRMIISHLPEREREIIHLHDVEGMDYEDIAEVVGTSVMAARMACSRARQKVKEEFEKIMSYGV
jgi:RNA polymerase sigma-70 factor (ECF subfamily)